MRDLIYAGRLPSLRVGRLHYIKAADLELERQRRLGLPLPSAPRRAARPLTPRPRRPRAAQAQPRADRSEGQAQLPILGDGSVRCGSELRRQRAAERAELASRWAHRHSPSMACVPAHILAVTSPETCESCGREVRHGQFVEFTPEIEQAAVRLCVGCGRRTLLDWADRQRELPPADRFGPLLGGSIAELRRGAERQLARKSSTSLATRSSCSRCNMCPAASTYSTRAPAMRDANSSA